MKFLFSERVVLTWRYVTGILIILFIVTILEDIRIPKIFVAVSSKLSLLYS